jgi:hypothetical protein
VGDQVARAELAQHGRLRRLEAPQLHGHDDRPHERDECQSGGREGDDAGGGREVVHGARG